MNITTMKINILIDNTPDNKEKCVAEHGLSMLMEDADKQILIDTGLSGKFIDNALYAGIDLNDIDFCFLSHGHNDHTGGLQRFLEKYPDIKVYLSERIFHERYFTSRHSDKKDLSTDAETLQHYENRLIPVKESTWITDKIAAVFCTHNEYPKPLGNIFLTKETNTQVEQDDFKHEMAMTISTDHGLVIFSSCSHCGCINIIKSCQDFTGEKEVAAFVGGLHFVDCQRTEQEVKTFVNDIQTTFPDIHIYTGHCTSDKAKNFLKESNINIDFFHTNEEIMI